MTRRWPFLSASVVLLVATLFAPPARALDEPERLRLVGERTFADGLYPIARRVLERLVADYPKDDRIGDALLLLGRARFALGDTAPARRVDSLQRRVAAPRELRHEVSTPQAGPGRAVPAGLGAREVGRHEGGARRPARVRRRGAEPRAGAGGAADDHRDAHALRRPERAAGHLQDADGADAADAGGALRRGLDRGPARPAQRPGDGVAPPPERVPRSPPRHALPRRPW